MVVCGRMNSSWSRITSPMPSSTGTMDCLKRPASRAAPARCCERSAYASTCSRVKPSSVAIRSALMPCGMNAVSKAVSGSQAQGPRSVPIGTRDMDSTPPATTRSSQPERTFCAAMFTASSPEAQKRLSCTPEARIVPAGGERGGLGDAAALLAHRRDAAHDHVVHLRGVEVVALCSSFSTPVSSEIGFTSCSEPLDLPRPRGVRIASKTIASAIALPPPCNEKMGSVPIFPPRPSEREMTSFMISLVPP